MARIRNIARKATKKAREQNQQAQPTENEEKKLEGADFWAFLFLAAIKDGLEVLFAVVGMASMGIVAPPLLLPFMLITLGIYASIWVYLRVNISFGLVQVATMVVTFITEIIPLMPGTTLWLLMARWIANSQGARTAARAITRR